MELNTKHALPTKITVEYHLTNGDCYRVPAASDLDSKTFALALEARYNSHDALVDALRVLTDHAQEQYPHFESERGQADIARALNVLGEIGAKP